MAILEVTGLSIFYGRVPAVHDISFEVDAGRIVALVGSNGAGKSSTLRAISGLVRSGRGGSVVLEGTKLDGMAAFKRARLGLAHVPEGRQLFPRLTVRQNLEAAGKGLSRRETAQRITEVVDLFPEVSKRLGQHAGSLSGGEQQMVAFGRAIMTQPKVVMLDEPALGLAPIVISRLREAIVQLAADGRAVLLAEQHVDLALRCAHELKMLVAGRISTTFDLAGADRESPKLRDEILTQLIGN